MQPIELLNRGAELIPTRVVCKDCGKETDPDWCWCGDRIDLHHWTDGHSPVPMGCICGFVKEKDDTDNSILATGGSSEILW